MVGSIPPTTIPTGQGQNAFQQAQAEQGPAQAENRDPRENEVQRREAPAAQSQESSSQSLRAPREEQPTELERGLEEARDPTNQNQANNDNLTASAERGSLVDLSV